MGDTNPFLPIDFVSLSDLNRKKSVPSIKRVIVSNGGVKGISDQSDIDRNIKNLRDTPKTLRCTHQDYASVLKSIFYENYSNHIRQTELSEIQNVVFREEEKLRMYKECFKQNAAIFDEFLKEHDRKSIEAMTRAEEQFRKRTELSDQLERLKMEEQRLNADINRLQDTVADYKYFRDFLESLIPEPYRSEREKARKEKYLARKVLKKMKRSLPAVRTSVPGSRIRRQSLAIPRRSVISIEEPKRSADPKILNLLEEEQSSSDESDREPYYTSPDQVLSTISDLEERNLRLIRNSQETQETIDALRNQLQQSKRNTEADTIYLKKLHDGLKAGIQRQINKSQQLEVNFDERKFDGLNRKQQEEILAELHGAVTQAYCYSVTQTDAPLESLDMLTEMESKLIALLHAAEKIPRERFEEMLAEKQQLHRKETMVERKNARKREHEEKRQKAIERARSEPVKISGRKLMQRSEPVQMAKDVALKEEENVQEQNELLFLFG